MAEAENIVVATAEKIFADLADPQTINHDKNGGWRLPLWQALSEAGLPLAWVAEELGGAGADLADGFAVVNAAGRFAVAVPLAPSSRLSTGAAGLAAVGSQDSTTSCWSASSAMNSPEPIEPTSSSGLNATVSLA